MPDATTRKLSQTFPSEFRSVAAIETLTEQWAQEAGFDGDTASNIAMVSREAAINAVFHGNRQAPDKSVTADLELSAEALTIRIADQGPGMDPDAIPDPSLPENLLRASGRGVFLMRALMDEVRFRRLQGVHAPGWEITLIKRR